MELNQIIRKAGFLLLFLFSFNLSAVADVTSPSVANSFSVTKFGSKEWKAIPYAQADGAYLSAGTAFRKYGNWLGFEGSVAYAIVRWNDASTLKTGFSLLLSPPFLTWKEAKFYAGAGGGFTWFPNVDTKSVVGLLYAPVFMGLHTNGIIADFGYNFYFYDNHAKGLPTVRVGVQF